MTIDEAIQRSEAEVDGFIEEGCFNTAKAIKLGIEALKLLQIERKTTIHHLHTLLPGETEE